VVQYNPGATLASTDYNSSSRINQVTDFTGTYSFGYTSYAITNYPSPGLPHLTGLTAPSGVPANFALTYASATLEPPFGSDSRYSGATTMHLATVTPPIGNAYSFTYDTASAGELLQVRFPYGGCLGWGYVSFTYAGGRILREAGSRSLAADSACATKWNYTISRNDTSNPNPTVHANMTLVDASGVGSKTWNFITTNTSGYQAWQVGLLSSFVQQASSGGTTMQQDTFTWVTVHDPNSSNPQSAQTNQTLDQYGNVTQSVVYGYNNTSAPIQTYNNTYVYNSAYQSCPTNPNCAMYGGSSPADSAYASNYVYNRMATTSLVLPGNVTKALLTNFYDQGTPTASKAPSLLDGTVSTARGDVTISVTLASTTSTGYYDTGSTNNVYSRTGRTASCTGLSSSNLYAAPGTITTESYSASVSYNGWMAVTSTTGANNEQLYMTYDPTTGRPLTGTSAFGGVTTYSYSAAGTIPMTQTESGPNGVTMTTLDGLGRPILVQRGDSGIVNSTTSFTSTVYEPCACSPLGKMHKVSMPYPSGGTEYWTTYTYDGLARPVSVQKPDGASTTT